jgi:hypothetical protein
MPLREEHRFRAFENKTLRRIFGPKREKFPPVSGGDSCMLRSCNICVLRKLLLLSLSF